MVYTYQTGILKERMNKLAMLSIALLFAFTATLGLFSPASAAYAAWNQKFEENTDGWQDNSNGWYGTITRVSTNTNDIESSDGDWHAVVEGDDISAPFSRFGGFSDEWQGEWIAEIDVYLDPAMPAGNGFDYSVAASRNDGSHLRDYIFHVTKDTSTGELLVAGSNNTNFSIREDLETLDNHQVTEAGWYTLQHRFYDDNGILSVDLNLLDSTGTVLFTETRSNAADDIASVVGGNRYAWFTVINSDEGFAIDNHQLVLAEVEPTKKDDCKKDGWAAFGFDNQGRCIQFVNTGRDSR